MKILNLRAWLPSHRMARPASRELVFPELAVQHGRMKRQKAIAAKRIGIPIRLYT